MCLVLEVLASFTSSATMEKMSKGIPVIVRELAAERFLDLLKFFFFWDDYFVNLKTITKKEIMIITFF